MESIPPAITEYTDQSISAIHHTLRSSRRRLAVVLVARRAIWSANDPVQETQRTSKETDDEVAMSVRQLAKEIVVIEENVTLEHATGDSYHNVYTARPCLDA
jgi:hypothetical protein